MTIERRTNRRARVAVAFTLLATLLVVAVARIVAAPTANGRIVYSVNSTTPQHRSYAASTTTFSAAAAMQTGAGQTWMVDRAAPTRNEHIAGYVTTGGVLYIQRWNGTAWSAEWNVTVGGAGVDGRRFDIVYENTSGDAIVVYSNNTTGANELRYRVWNGTSWTAATNLDSARLTGTPNAIKLAARTTSGSDEIAATIADSNSILTTLVWNGTAWGNEPGTSHGTLAGTAGQNDLFDHAYESASGDLLVIFTTSTPQQNHRAYSGGTWGGVTSWATGRSAPLQMVAAANPDPASNQILCMFNRGASANVYARIWDGGAFGTQTTVGGNGATTAIEQRTINAGWLKSGTSTVAVAFWDSTTTTNVIDYNYTTNGGTSWAGATTYTGITMGSRRWFDVDEDPQATDTLMLTVSDSNSDLFARQLTWNGTALAWATPTNGTITTGLANVTTQNFDFSYDRWSPPAATLTVGNGTNPGDGAACPGGTATMMDAFTLQTSAGTDTVTAVTVTLAAGTSAGLSLVEITNDAGSTVYGSVANPATDTPSIALTPNITATTTATQYKVRVTPKSHANMPIPPGSTYAVSGTLTAVTSSLTKSYSDTASSTVTIDNASPSDATWGTVTPGNTQVVLNWTNPGTDFGQVVILRSTATIADAPTEGASYIQGNTIGASTVRYVGALQTFTDTGLTNGTGYLYKIFVRDACGNYSSGIETGPHTPSAPVPAVTPGSPSAVVDACNQITVTAPFTGDTDGDSSTLFNRGASPTGPWVAACSKNGASPRVCTDTGVTAGGTYYYQIDFTDPDGVSGTDPQVIGPYNTPASCIVAGTTAGTVTAQISSCRQITVTAPFTGDGDADGSIKVEYNTTNTWPGTVACASVTGPSPRQCLVTGLSPSTTYYVRTTWVDTDGVTGTNPQTSAALALPACAADQVAPMALILSPMRDAVVGGTERVKVQVWDEGGLAATTPVQWSVDSGAFAATGVAANSNYSCGSGCTVYEFDLNTTALANGSHALSVQVTDAAGNVARTAWAFRSNNDTGAPKGAGTLLRRTTGSQLCVDCHAIATHSSQETSTKYGNWAIDCLTCHTPHKTANVYLLRPSIQTPGSGTNAIEFRTSDKSGGSNPQYAHLGDYSGAGNTPYTDGICETCHTKTNHYRNDTSGGDHTHNASTRCIGCHKHADGFAAGESTGGYRCSDCHPAIWQGMTGAVAKTSKHTLGAVQGTNDSFTDSNVTYGNPLDAVTAANRKCLSCHQDHIHNNPGGATHDFNVHKDASTQASRSVTRDGAGNITAGTPARSDFDATDTTNGGMCLSCHKNGVSSTRPAIDRAAYDLSAHDYATFSTYGAWTFDLHDGSKFDRNCTKCHSDRSDARPSDATAPFGSVHFSDYPMLLSGSKNPAGAPATFVCYNCHGNGTTGLNLSGKPIATTMAKTRNHTSNNDSVHDSVAEYSGAAFGNTLGGKARHASCMDCHDTHKAKAGLHTAQTNLAGPSLEGAWGAQLSTNPAFWAAPTSASFTKKVIVAGTDVEATLCFKCHSSYYGTLPTTPSGTYTETDTAREFNPNNSGTAAPTRGAFHPVLASAGNNLGATSNIIAPWTRTSLMTCSDCHASDTTTDPGGPHGSAAGFMLKGPNTTWSATVVTTSTGMPAGTFCANCHNANFTNSRMGTQHTSRSDHRIACWNCHSAIPHGTSQPGLLVSGGTYGNKTTDVAPWNRASSATGSDLWIISYPANNTTNWSRGNCGCGGTGH